MRILGDLVIELLYCGDRDGKVMAMTLMALIKVTTNITPIQHKLIRARQELSKMAPKNVTLVRGVSDATTIPATAEELAQLRATLPAPPKADLGDTVDGFRCMISSPCKFHIALRSTTI